MSDTLQGQVTASAAEVYETFFVPALFEEWAPRVADAAALAAGQSVLDVACGTGVLAREAVRRGCSVTGLDRNEGMLAVARGRAPDVEWRAGTTESLPFADAAFDAVVCQFGLMFFEDRATALREMWRVLRPGGRLAVAVWDVLDHSPGYAAMERLLHRLFGERIANELRVPFALGKPSELQALFTDAGIPIDDIITLPGTARFPSIDAWVFTDVKGWTLADLIDDTQYDLLLTEARRDMAQWLQTDTTVAFACPANIITATKP